MITQPIFNSKQTNNQNDLTSIFGLGPLQDVYNAFVEQIKRNPMLTLVMSCCGFVGSIEDFIFYGHYTRRQPIIDVRRDMDTGKWVIEEIEDFKISRILCAVEKEKPMRTHALLFHLFVPYGNYSMRAVLYYIMLFYQSNLSMSAFCARHSLNLSTFSKWKRWLRKYAPDLMNVRSSLNGRLISGYFLRAIKNRFLAIYDRCLFRLRRSFFQTHATHEHSVRLYATPITC